MDSKATNFKNVTYIDYYLLLCASTAHIFNVFLSAYAICTFVGRPHRSRFTRIQRLTCCLSLLFCTMYASIQFYDGSPDDGQPVQSLRVS